MIVINIVKGITGPFAFLMTLALTMIAGVILQSSVSAVSSALGGPDFGQVTKEGVMGMLNDLFSHSNKSKAYFSDGLIVIGACFEIITFIPAMAIYEQTRACWEFALATSMALLAFINLKIGDAVLGIACLGVSILCVGKTLADFKSLKSPEISLLAIISGTVGASLGITTFCIAWVEE
jgi:hypothetical protein